MAARCGTGPRAGGMASDRGAPRDGGRGPPRGLGRSLRPSRLAVGFRGFYSLFSRRRGERGAVLRQNREVATALPYIPAKVNGTGRYLRTSLMDALHNASPCCLEAHFVLAFVLLFLS